MPQKMDFDKHFQALAEVKAVRTYDLDPPSPMHAFARILMTPLPPGLRAHY